MVMNPNIRKMASKEFQYKYVARYFITCWLEPVALPSYSTEAAYFNILQIALPVFPDMIKSIFGLY